MATTFDLVTLIDEAASKAGNQARLAELMGVPKSHITQMKQGNRPANWRVRGKLRAILGEDPTHAFMAAMAEDLAQSDREDEKKAADGFRAMLAAFPDDWRKRMIATLAAVPLQVVRGLRGAVHGALDCGFRYSVLVR